MGAPADTIRLDLPANPRYLNVLGDCIAALLSHVNTLPDPQTTIYNVQLAVHEACANIIDHAYDGQGGRIHITMALNWQPPQLTIELVDTGKSFDPSAVPPTNLDEPHVRGYGLHLMKQLMDEVVYQTASSSNTWRLVKNL